MTTRSSEPRNVSLKAVRVTSRVLTYIIVIVAALVCVLPFLWMVSTAFKGPSEIYKIPLSFIPDNPTLDNFTEGWKYADFSLYTRNTVIITVSATIGTIISSALVAYGFSRFNARLKGFLFTLLLATMMLPAQVILIPQYMLFNKLGFVDTPLPMIIPAWLGGGAFNIFLFIQFFNSIPRELDDAARIDGAGSFQVFARILLPSVKPVVMAIGVMSFVFHWNDFFQPLIYLNSEKWFTIAIGLQFFKSGYGNTQIGMMMAVSLLTLLPVLIIFFIFQRYFVEGIKLSGLKG